MKNLEFSYNMRIEFSMPVIKHCFSLRCIPFDNEYQRITSLSTQISPDNMLSQTTDGFGNRVLTDRILEQHTEFSVCVKGTAEVDLSKRQREELNGIYKYASQYTKKSENIDRFLKSLPDGFVTTPVDTAERLMQEIHKVFSYKSNVTNINTTADEALGIGSGVCQDFSHILIAVCRALKIPARYVAGIQNGTGETHAWAEVYEDGMWIGIDVTNNKMIDETYIALSHGRDFADCGINRGLFIGGGTQKQSIEAYVRVL